MFPCLPSAHPPANVCRGSGCVAHFARAVCALLPFLVALCISPSSVAQSANPMGALLGKSQAQTSQSAPAPVPPAEAQPPTAIPLPEVSKRAEDLMRLLREVNGQLPTREQLDAIKARLDERDSSLQAKQKEVEKLLAASPSALELREQETYWHAVSADGANTRRLLLDWANSAQSAVQQLEVLQPQWTLTLEEYKSTPNLGPTLDVIRDAVKSIQTAKAQAQDLLRVIVNLQVTAANQHQLSLDMLDRVAQARRELKDHALRRDSLPLWHIFSRRQQEEPADFFRNSAARVIGIESFAQENSVIFVALAVVLLLSLLGAYRLHTATRGIKPSGELQAQALAITRRWLALGLLPPLLVA